MLPSACGEGASCPLQASQLWRATWRLASAPEGIAGRAADRMRTEVPAAAGELRSRAVAPEVGLRRVGTGLPARCRRFPGWAPAASCRFADAGSCFSRSLLCASLMPGVPAHCAAGRACARVLRCPQRVRGSRQQQRASGPFNVRGRALPPCRRWLPLTLPPACGGGASSPSRPGGSCARHGAGPPLRRWLPAVLPPACAPRGQQLQESCGAEPLHRRQDSAATVVRCFCGPRAGSTGAPCCRSRARAGPDGCRPGSAGVRGRAAAQHRRWPFAESLPVCVDRCRQHQQVFFAGGHCCALPPCRRVVGRATFSVCEGGPAAPAGRGLAPALLLSRWLRRNAIAPGVVSPGAIIGVCGSSSSASSDLCRALRSPGIVPDVSARRAAERAGARGQTGQRALQSRRVMRRRTGVPEGFRPRRRRKCGARGAGSARGS